MHLHHRKLRSPRCALLALSAALWLSGCESDPATSPARSAASPTAPAAVGAVTGGAEQATAKAVAEPPSPDGSGQPAGAAHAVGTVADTAAGSARPGDAAAAVMGAKKTDTRYQVWLQTAGDYHVGKPATVQAVLVAKGRYHCNEKYPYKLKLDAPPEGVSYPAPIARKISNGKQRRVLTVPFTSSTAGPKSIGGTFFFSVCDEATCKLGKERLSITVAVK